MGRPRLTLVEFSPSGGLFQFALQLAEGLAATGYDVELLTGRDPELQPRSAGVRVLPMLPTWHPQAVAVERAWQRKARRVWRAVLYVEAWRRSWRHLVRTRPDVVQLSEWRFALDGAVVAMLARRLGDGVVVGAVAHTPRPLVEQRTSGDLHKEGATLDRALAAAYRSMDVVFVLGERSRAELLAAFPAVRRVEVVPHGDGGLLVAPGLPAVADTAQRVLLFGTIARYKGVDLLLDAWSAVRAAESSAELVLAGAPVDIDVAALEARAAALGGVTLRLGYVPTEEVSALLGSARVVVAPYLRANQSGVTHLAYTAGRPVVATDVGDLSTVVRHGETGFLVPAGDAQALAEALLVLLRDPATAERLGTAGGQRLAAGASWPDVARQIRAVYDDVLANRQ